MKLKFEVWTEEETTLFYPCMLTAGMMNLTLIQFFLDFYNFFLEFHSFGYFEIKKQKNAKKFPYFFNQKY
jgi:hypothetical protein